MYIFVDDLGVIQSWSYDSSDSMEFVEHSIVPENHVEGFSKKRWAYIDGSFVERNGWLEEWNENLKAWNDSLLTQSEITE